jgi:hypothetical protein
MASANLARRFGRNPYLSRERKRSRSHQVHNSALVKSTTVKPGRVLQLFNQTHFFVGHMIFLYMR